MSVRLARVADGFEQAVAAAATALLESGVVVFPTETVYGIGAKWDDAPAMKTLRSLKGRSGEKPFQLLMSDFEMAASLGAAFSEGAENLARAFWPGPLTLVVPHRDGSRTLGLRLPDSPFVRNVARAIGGAIAASSANPAGMPPPVDAAAADVFGDAVRLLVDGGPCRVGEASSVVLAKADGFTVLREGAIPRDRLARAWEAGAP
jgi:L-threonylcarbamoyladenylate synthase